MRFAACSSALPGTRSACGCAPPARVAGETKVVSTAAWAPCHRGSPFASTSMRRPSARGMSTFMSRKKTLVATRAPASRQTRAAALSKAAARAPRTPDYAGRRTSCTVVTQGIECTSTPAPPWPDWHGQAQASEQHNAETRARESELRCCGKCCEGAGAARACLGQQVVPQQWLARTSARDVDPADRRRLDLVVYGATLVGEALCCDVTLVSPLTLKMALPSL